MSTGLSYSLQDFIPFTADIYFRLLERMSESYWPLHLLMLALGLVTCWLAWKHHARLAAVLIAPAWGFVAYAFFMQLYAELNWAGGYITYFFFTQAILLLMALTGIGLDSRPRTGASAMGITIVLAGLLVMPFIGPLSSGCWLQAEVFGVHPDPTAVTTLGLVVILFRGWYLWLIAVIPALWLLYSGLTLWALGANPAAMVIFVLLGTAMMGLVCKSFGYSLVTQDNTHDG
jgi:hypothetical protein